jgi:hypothetical protein
MKKLTKNQIKIITGLANTGANNIQEARDIADLLFKETPFIQESLLRAFYHYDSDKFFKFSDEGINKIILNKIMMKACSKHISEFPQENKRINKQKKEDSKLFFERFLKIS